MAKQDNRQDNEQDKKIMALEIQNWFIMKKLDSIEEKLDNFIDCSDRKYATKNETKINEMRIKKIEENLNKAVWIILTGIILAVLWLIINL